MIRVGILGAIGSGKSFIAKLFKCPIFNADREVKKIYNKNKKCFINLKRKIPNFIKSFPIRKDELVKAINHDKKNLSKISSIVHPLVRKKMVTFLDKNKKSKLVILDVPLLIENKLNKKNDILIFVKSKRSKIINRLKKRANFNPNIMKTLKENQVILKKKMKLANYIIENNSTPNIMKNKVNILKNKIINERSSSRY